MPSTYTQNLGIEQPATGEQAGTWGTTANTSYAILDAAIAGSVSIPLSNSQYVLSTGQGVMQNGDYPLIIWTGTLAQQGSVAIGPNTAQKRYFMRNQTAGGFGIAFQQQGASGAQFTLQAGHDAVIYCDGLGTTASVYSALDNPQFTNVLVTGSLTVASVTSSGNHSFMGGAQTVWYPANNALDFEAQAIQTADGYALRFGSAGFGEVNLALDNAGRVGIGTVTPSTILDVRPASSAIQLTTCLSALVGGNNSGGAIYFGGDTANSTPTNATAAIEVSWGGASLPQLGIGVVWNHVTANVLMDYNGNTYIRNGGAVHLAVLGTGSVGVGTASPANLFHVSGGRSQFTDPGEPYNICLDYGSGVAVIYCGTNSAGQFQISSAGGGSLVVVDQNGNMNITGSLGVPGNASVSGTLSAAAFSGGSLNITGNGSVSGTLAAGTLSGGTLSISGNGTVSGTMSAGAFNGGSLSISGNGSVAALNASSVSVSGALSAGSISAGGWVHATGNGFQFPDGTTQTTAAVTAPALALTPHQPTRLTNSTYQNTTGVVMFVSISYQQWSADITTVYVGTGSTANLLIYRGDSSLSWLNFFFAVPIGGSYLVSDTHGGNYAMQNVTEWY